MTETATDTDTDTDDSTDRRRVYLAGPVHDREDSGTTWRDEVTSKHGLDGIEWVDPLDKYVNGDESPADWDAEQIVANDLSLLDTCDAVLVHYRGERTFGTPMEIFHAANRGLPVVVVWDCDLDVSPWVEHYADAVTSSLSLGLRRLIKALADYREWQTTDDDRTSVDTYDAAEDIEFIRALRSDTEEMKSIIGEYADRIQSDSAPDTEIPPIHEETRQIPDGDTLAGGLLRDTASLITDSRDTHGDAVANQEHIAEGWTWYLRGCGLLSDDAALDGADVARLMTLVKHSRGAVGEYDVDHDRDVAGYAAIAAACEATADPNLVDEIMPDGGEE